MSEHAEPDDIRYGIVENLLHLGVTDPALHEEGFAFWKERFFGDPHQRHDVEIAGARAYVHACYEAGAVVVYLTGRDLPNMALGSFASLRDLGFPEQNMTTVPRGELDSSGSEASGWEKDRRVEVSFR